MQTPPDLEFACSCGTVKGFLVNPGPRSGDHIVCHCNDCQNFARILGAGDRFLDGHGGTDLYQGRCAHMRLTQGRDRLACLHLTEKPTLRWYADCCSTPLFNSYANGRIPYLTILVANCLTDDPNRIFGPVIGHLFTEGMADMPDTAPKMTMGGLMRRFLPRMVKDLVSGNRRRSELFDPRTLAPITPPRRVMQEAC